MDRPETRYVLSGNVHVAYQLSGSGPTDLVWAPGTVSHVGLDWDLPPKARFMRRLGGFTRLIRFDKRGTGLSDRLTDAATLEERIDDIRSVLDAAGSERAFVFGVSEGANMACLFAATHPGRTSGLLIWGGRAQFHAPDHPGGATAQDAETFLADSITNRVAASLITGETDTTAPASAETPWQEFMVRYLRAAASPSAVLALEVMDDHLDLRDILPTIRVPTLVMTAEDDPAAPVGAARDLASRIAGARFVTFHGEHIFFLDDAVADAVADQIEEFVTGTRSAPGHDRVLATVLFTDIVGSTEHLVAAGDRAWRQRVASHHDIVRKELDLHRGHEVDTAGDGFFATFDGPGRSVACARSIIERLRPLGIEIRAGIHTGECETIGEKVGGIAVHIAARVAALAGPSEILVSSTVKDLTAGSGITFEDAGERELKGIPDRWRLYRVVGRIDDQP